MFYRPSNPKLVGFKTANHSLPKIYDNIAKYLGGFQSPVCYNKKIAVASIDQLTSYVMAGKQTIELLIDCLPTLRTRAFKLPLNQKYTYANL